ncbi:hypothetical protein B9Z19DRAFT_824044 [Tuber borchii]|uniref:Uncharacterized protein n=1 Tax=Tuber borchii TaxID=42251 RepID=A0A2T6ZVF5_TUBBO|nr:hypothetical protein B9Z19DRAFT_824044 [Tuber borchii]
MRPVLWCVCVMIYHSYVCVFSPRVFFFPFFLPVLYNFGRVMVGHSGWVFLRGWGCKIWLSLAWLGWVWGGYCTEVW